MIDWKAIGRRIRVILFKEYSQLQIATILLDNLVDRTWSNLYYAPKFQSPSAPQRPALLDSWR